MCMIPFCSFNVKQNPPLNNKNCKGIGKMPYDSLRSNTSSRKAYRVQSTYRKFHRNLYRCGVSFGQLRTFPLVFVSFYFLSCCLNEVCFSDVKICNRFERRHHSIYLFDFLLNFFRKHILCIVCS